MSVYQIQKGDTLWNIVKSQYNLTSSKDIKDKIGEITKENDIENANLIYAGATLNLPGLFDEDNGVDCKENSLFSNGTQEGVDGFYSFLNGTDKIEKATEELAKHDISGLTGDELLEAMEKEQDMMDNLDKLLNETFKLTDKEIQKKEDGTIGAKEYSEAISPFVKDLENSLNKDNEDGLDEKEFFEFSKKIASSMGYQKAQFEEIAGEIFQMFDFNNNKKVETNELTGVFAAFDAKDGKIDGQFNLDNFLASMEDTEATKAFAKDFSTKAYGGGEQAKNQEYIKRDDRLLIA